MESLFVSCLTFGPDLLSFYSPEPKPHRLQHYKFSHIVLPLPLSKMKYNIEPAYMYNVVLLCLRALLFLAKIQIR